MNNLDNDLIRNIISVKRKTELQRLDKNINNWAIENKKDIDRLFKYLLKSLDNNNLDINVELKILYRDFVKFTYIKSTTFI
uniref:Uncharacterized protein n=1 Tax=viral metagenome TaxID=1070528 RepID=A0A6C0IZP6_9ZZZZ